MSWNDLVNGARTIIGVVDHLVFDLLPLAFDRYVSEMPIWSIVLAAVVMAGFIVYWTLAPTRRGGAGAVGVSVVTQAAGKASRGLFTIGFYGSILLAFASVIVRNIS